MPVLIKEIKTGQINKYFYVQKIFKTCLILWENAQCVCAKSHIFSPKALFSIQFFGVNSLATLAEILNNGRRGSQLAG